MDFIDYREKLGVGLSDNEKIKKFYIKIFNILDGLDDGRTMRVDFNEYYAFCNDTGTEMNVNLIDERDGFRRFAHCVSILKSHKQDIRDFLSFYIWFINSYKNQNNYPWDRKKFVSLLTKSLDECHISYSLIEEDGRFFVFPKGAKELDDALVSEPLDWLKDYPATHKAFVKALKAYSEVTEENASDVADLFRKALETFFQEFFNTSKSLENLKSEYGTYMKNKGVPTEISNNLETLQQSYTNFMNGYAKHHDKTSINVLEYLMYQTGNMIRLLITLKGV